jgi:hypothetical protein
MATKYTKWPQNITNGHKIYQMATKYNKWPQNMPNGSKIDQMALKYTAIVHYKTLENLPKLGFFGLKIYHLATLHQRSANEETILNLGKVRVTQCRQTEEGATISPDLI